MILKRAVKCISTFLKTKQQCTHKKFFLLPQAGNLLRLPAGRLRLDPVRLKNFFAVRNLNRKKFFVVAIGFFNASTSMCYKLVMSLFTGTQDPI